MSQAEILHRSFVVMEVNANYTEAVLTLRDQSRLCFCHRVGERWAKAVGLDPADNRAGHAGEVLAVIRMFRLNAKHLDMQFLDGSRWEKPFRDRPTEA
jgi:hypothetical protein